MKHYWFGAVLVFLVLRFSAHRWRFAPPAAKRLRSDFLGT
jgi:hypothetical protein